MADKLSNYGCIAEDGVIEKLKHKYCAGNVIPFIGAGLSTVFQMPSWGELLRQCQEALNCKKEMSDELTVQFEKYLGAFQYREAADILEEKYGDAALKEAVVELLKRGSGNGRHLSDLWEITDNNYKDLGDGSLFKWFFTTNYERSLDHFIKGNFTSYSLRHDKPNMQEIFQANDRRYIFYLHGNCENPESIVLTSKDYKALYENNIYTSKFGLFGGTKSFLFLGFSLNDKDICDLLNKHAMMFGGEHFIVTRDMDLAESLVKSRKEHQNGSENKFNEGQNNFCIYPIFLCGDSDYVGELRKFLRMLYQTPLIGCLQKWVKTQSAKYDARGDKRDISPYLISDVSFPDGAKNDPMPLSGYIKHYCLYGQKNFQLIAEGGMGKTVQLLKAAQELLETGISVFYIPLYMLNNMTLDEFIAKKILKTPKLYKEFQECKGPDYSINRQTIFMLDGFNELSLDAQSNISTEVMELIDCDGIQILASGREEISILPLEKLKLEPLRKENVQRYLKDAAPDIKSDMWKLLEIPMMAQLYKSTEAYRNTKSHLPSKLSPFAWRIPIASRADILWNYIQSQYFNSRNMTECFEYIVALEFAVCAIAWKMVNTHSFVVSRSHFNEWLRDAMADFEIKARSIQRIYMIWDGLECFWNCADSFNHIQDILLNKLNFLITSESYQEVYFCHQYLRDFLAAVYMKNEAQGKISSSLAWNEFMADKNVLSLLGELCTTDELLEIWKRQRQENRKSGFGDTPGYYASNWLETVKRRGGPFGTPDFSWQDLRNVRFTEDIKITPPFCFDHTLISRNTFLSDEHIGNILCAKWSPDGGHIATGSDDGTVKIWDSRNGSCLVTLVLKSEVRCLVWTPDRKHLVMGTGKGDICIWNVKEENCPYEPVNIGVAVEGIEVLYRRDTWLLLVTVGQGFLLYDVTSQKGQFMKISRPDAVAVTQDFQFVIMSFYSTVAVWKVDSLLEGSNLNPLGTYETPLGELKALVLLEEKNKLLAGENEGTIFEFCLSDLLSGNPSVGEPKVQKLDSVGSLDKIERNPLTNQMVVSTFHGVMIWDEWFQNRLYEDEIECDGLASWSPDSRRLLIQKRFNNGIDIIDFSMYRESIQPEPLIATNPWITGRYSWSPGGRYLACASGSMILIWDLQRNVLVTRLNHSEEIIGNVMWSEDERKIYFLEKRRCRRHRDFWFETLIKYTATCFKLTTKKKENCAECEWNESNHFGFFDDHAQFQLVHWSPDLKQVMLEHDKRIYIMKLSDRSILLLAHAEAFKHQGIHAVIKWSRDSRYLIGVCDHQIYIIWDSKTGKIIEQYNINKSYIKEFREKRGVRSTGTTIYFDKNRTKRKHLKGKYILNASPRRNEYIYCQLDLKLKATPAYTLNTSFSHYVAVYETEDGKKEYVLSLDGENIVINAGESMPVYLRQGNQNKLLFRAPVHEILRFGIKWLNDDSIIQETETDIIVWNIQLGQAVKSLHKSKQNVQEYVISPYSDDFIGIQYAGPDKFECFWHGSIDSQNPMKSVPFIKTFPLIGSTFHGAQFQDDELERAVYCSGGQLSESYTGNPTGCKRENGIPDPAL